MIKFKIIGNTYKVARIKALIAPIITAFLATTENVRRHVVDYRLATSVGGADIIRTDRICICDRSYEAERIREETHTDVPGARVLHRHARKVIALS